MITRSQTGPDEVEPWDRSKPAIVRLRPWIECCRRLAKKGKMTQDQLAWCEQQRSELIKKERYF
jgi:hypothetical protein